MILKYIWLLFVWYLFCNCLLTNGLLSIWKCRYIKDNFIVPMAISLWYRVYFTRRRLLYSSKVIELWTMTYLKMRFWVTYRMTMLIIPLLSKKFNCRSRCRRQKAIQKDSKVLFNVMWPTQNGCSQWCYIMAFWTWHIFLSQYDRKRRRS